MRGPDEKVDENIGIRVVPRRGGQDGEIRILINAGFLNAIARHFVRRPDPEEEADIRRQFEQLNDLLEVIGRARRR
jgi:hypothetical protein